MIAGRLGRQARKGLADFTGRHGFHQFSPGLFRTGIPLLHGAGVPDIGSRQIPLHPLAPGIQRCQNGFRRLLTLFGCLQKPVRGQAVINRYSQTKIMEQPQFALTAPVSALGCLLFAYMPIRFVTDTPLGLINPFGVPAIVVGLAVVARIGHGMDIRARPWHSAPSQETATARP